MRIALASSNRGKVDELRQLLPDSIEITTAQELGIELPEETGETFLENALLKARVVASDSGLVAVADDSGLEVDALSGAPGVRSARYAGDPSDDSTNNTLLLRNLSGIEFGQRTARFRSVVAAVAPNGTEFHADGVIEGHIVCATRGESGFGYDPLFQPTGYERTFAELSLDEKNRISHRGIALRRIAKELVPFLKQYQTDQAAGSHRNH